jgi:hypothetical protein
MDADNKPQMDADEADSKPQMTPINADSVLKRDARQAAQNEINVLGRVSISSAKVASDRQGVLSG